MNEASVTVTGNISTDMTSKRVGEDGTLVVSFWMISSPRRRDRATGEWADGDRFMAKVSCWRRLGDNVMTSLRKGDPVVVRGKVSVQEYEVNGERRQSVEINASAVGPDLERCIAPVVRHKAVGTDGANGASDEVVLPAAGVAGDQLRDPQDEHAPALAGSV